MRIAQIAPIVERVPPKKYGGTERVVHALTEELVRRGHDVTLFASGDSITGARLASVYPRAMREARLTDGSYDPSMWHHLHIGAAYDRAREFDIIHDHTVPASLPVAQLSPTPVLATMHTPFSVHNRMIFEALRRPHIVSISHAQTAGMPAFNHAGMVYNGLAMDDYPFLENHDDFLLFVGSLWMDKGAHIAIQVAQELDMRLIIAAKLDHSQEPYFSEYIAPHLTDRIQWIGEVDQEERNALISEAKCFLHPALWREPFGLVMIEAMACGTPVIAFNRGSIPEIVENGVTGFAVNDLDGMINAVASIDTINRAACRARVLQRFNEKRMVDGYEALYARIVHRAPYVSHASVRHGA